jgi:hypothetical protein
MRPMCMEKMPGQGSSVVQISQTNSAGGGRLGLRTVSPYAWTSSAHPAGRLSPPRATPPRPARSSAPLPPLMELLSSLPARCLTPGRGRVPSSGTCSRPESSSILIISQSSPVPRPELDGASSSVRLEILARESPSAKFRLSGSARRFGASRFGERSAGEFSSMIIGCCDDPMVAL